MRMVCQSFDEIAGCIGMEDALRLVEIWGGTRRYIPMNVAADHDLAKKFGKDRAQEIADALGHGYIDVPALRAQTRRQLVRQLTARRLTVVDIAAQLNLTEQRVYQIRRELNDDDLSRQTDLFPKEF